MKKEELFEVLGNLEPGMVEKARSDRHPRRGVWKKWTAAAACAVIIGGAVLGVATWRNGREGSAVRYPSGVTTVLAAYPASVERTMDAQKFMESDAHWDWWDSYRELTAKSAELQSGMDAYYQNLMKQMLVSEDENTVCSPINLYIAFAMLAETSDGNTRQQILDMLGAQDMDTLRENVSSLWESNYADTPALNSVLANSLWLDGEETIPAYYESQGRHYMAVMNVDEVFYCCLYGNNEDEVIIRHIDRDRDYEEELIALERDFWENHILTGTPPPYTEDGNLILNSVRRHFGPADPSAPELILEGNMALLVLRYLELQAQRNVEKRNYECIEAEMRRLQGRIVAEMGRSCTAVCQGREAAYSISYKPVRKSGISKENLQRLQAQHPDIYEQYVTVSESRRFYVKKQREEAA